MKIEVGEMPCADEDCQSHEAKRPVIIFLNDETGGLSSSCDKCGLSTFYKVGQPVRESMIRRYCAANEAQIRAAEKRSGKPHKAAAAPAPAAVPAAAAATSPAKVSKTETKQEEERLWRR